MSSPPALGAGGLRFKSGRPDHFSRQARTIIQFLKTAETKGLKHEDNAGPCWDGLVAIN